MKKQKSSVQTSKDHAVWQVQKASCKLQLMQCTIKMQFNFYTLLLQRLNEMHTKKYPKFNMEYLLLLCLLACFRDFCTIAELKTAMVKSLWFNVLATITSVFLLFTLLPLIQLCVPMRCHLCVLCVHVVLAGCSTNFKISIKMSTFVYTNQVVEALVSFLFTIYTPPVIGISINGWQLGQRQSAMVLSNNLNYTVCMHI